MPEVDKATMRQALARAVGMSEAEITRIDWPECYWDPERSWADAGRVLEAMRGKPRLLFRLFRRELADLTGENSGADWTWTMKPEHIAQAAYEVLSHGASH